MSWQTPTSSQLIQSASHHSYNDFLSISNQSHSQLKTKKKKQCFLNQFTKYLLFLLKFHHTMNIQLYIVNTLRKHETKETKLRASIVTTAARPWLLSLLFACFVLFSSFWTASYRLFDDWHTVGQCLVLFRTKNQLWRCFFAHECI